LSGGAKLKLIRIPR